VPALVPLAFHMLLLRDRNHILLGLVLLALVALLLFIHSRANAGVIDALTTRFKNLSLATSLETERQQSREATMAMETENLNRRRAESRALIAEKKLAMHLQISSAALVEWDMNFCVTDWNQQAEKMFGYTREQMLGHHAAELLRPEGRADMKAIWDDLIHHPDGMRFTTTNLTQDGRTIVCDWLAAAIYDANRTMIGITAIISENPAKQ
jgi:PAS domain S-box-containing protein